MRQTSFKANANYESDGSSEFCFRASSRRSLFILLMFSCKKIPIKKNEDDSTREQHQSAKDLSNRDGLSAIPNSPGKRAFGPLVFWHQIRYATRMPNPVFEYRNHLSLRDIDFVTSTLASSDRKQANALLQLLTDPATVDSILDHPDLFNRVLNSAETLSLSTRLYFYLLTRRALKESGLDCPELADYVAGVLESFMRSGFNPHSPQGVFYVVDWLKQVNISPNGKRYELYVMAGNHLLFLTGIFPDFIERRYHRRGAPSLAFYESVAKRSYQNAANHPFSQKVATADLYNAISESFPTVREALNDLSERLIVMEN